MNRCFSLAPFCVFLLLAGTLTGPTYAQGRGDLLSELLPMKVYQVDLTKTNSGNDGAKDIVPIVSSQSFRIETGNWKGDVFPVTLTVYRPVSARSSKKDATTPSSVIMFNVHKDGRFSDFSTTDPNTSETSLAPELNTYQYMEGILLMTRHELKRKRQRTYSVTKSSAGRGGMTNIEFTIKETAGSVPETAGLLTKRSGSALYDPANKFFVESSVTETNRIVVPGDGKQAAKEVLMIAKQEHKITIKNK